MLVRYVLIMVSFSPYLESDYRAKDGAFILDSDEDSKLRKINRGFWCSLFLVFSHFLVIYLASVYISIKQKIIPSYLKRHYKK